MCLSGVENSTPKTDCSTLCHMMVEILCFSTLGWNIPPFSFTVYLQPFSRYSAPNCLTSANRHVKSSRDLYHLCKICVYILISQPHIAYSLWHFYWAPMKIKGWLLTPETPNVKREIERKLFRPNLGKFWRFWGSGVMVSKSCDFYSKRHVLAWTHVVWAILRQNRSRDVTSRSAEKNPESQRLP